MERIKENTIVFEKVVTKEELLKLSEEEVNFAKKEGIYHAEYLRRVFSKGILSEFLSERARELAFLGHKYRDQKNVTKELIAATIALPDDEKFIKALLSNNIDYDQLLSISKAISSIKKITLLAKRLQTDDSVKVVNKKIRNLCLFIRNYFGIRDFNLILAKINEIAAFKKDLYKKLEEEQNNKEKILKL